MTATSSSVTPITASTRGTPRSCSHLTIGSTMVAITQASSTGTITGWAT